MNNIVKKVFATLIILCAFCNNIKAFEKKYLNTCPLSTIKKINYYSKPWSYEIVSKLYNNLVLTKRKSINIEYGALQGSTVTDKYIVFAHWISNLTNDNIYFLDNKTFDIKAIIPKYNFGHANDFTYNSKNKKLVITNNSDKDVNKLSTFDIEDKIIFNNNYKVNLINQYINYFNNSNNPIITNRLDNIVPTDSSGIAYDSDHNQYIIFDYISKDIYITDENFNYIRNFSTIDEEKNINPSIMTSQGFAYWNNHIYYATYEAGRPSAYQNVYNSNEASSSLIYVYDLDGNLDRIIYIPTSKLGFDAGSNYIKTGAEIESISFYEDGTMLLGFNIYPDYYTYKNRKNCMGGVSTINIAFYTSDSLKRDYLNLKNIEIKQLPKKMEYIKNSEKLDLTEGILELTYTDNIKEEINLDNDKISIEGFDNSKTGTNTITVKYGDLTTTFDVEIIAN